MEPTALTWKIIAFDGTALGTLSASGHGVELPDPKQTRVDGGGKEPKEPETKLAVFW